MKKNKNHKHKELLKKQMSKKELSELEKSNRVFFERPLGTISFDTKKNYNRNSKDSQNKRHKLKILY